VIDRERLWEHFNFGYKLTLAGILNTIFVNAYNIVIGKFFSVAQVGFYSKADSLQKFPVQSMSQALNKVTYPMFSEIQNDNVKLRAVYRTVMQQVVFWITPVLVVAFVVAEPLFRFILTEKWLPAVPYFRILCFVGFLYPVQAYNLNILKVKGRSDLILKLSIIKRIIITLGIVIALPFGVFGLLYFQVINSLISYFLNSYYSGKFIGYPASEQLKDIVPIIVQAILPGLICYFFWYHLFDLNRLLDFWQILIVSVSYLAIAISLNLWIKPGPYHEFKKLIFNYL